MSGTVDKQVFGQVSAYQGAALRSCSNMRFRELVDAAVGFWRYNNVAAVAGEFGIEWSPAILHWQRSTRPLWVQRPNASGMCMISAALMQHQQADQYEANHGGVVVDVADRFDFSLDEVWALVRGFDGLPVDHDLPLVISSAWAAPHPTPVYGREVRPDGEVPIRIPNPAAWQVGRWARSILKG